MPAAGTRSRLALILVKNTYHTAMFPGWRSLRGCGIIGTTPEGELAVRVHSEARGSEDQNDHLDITSRVEGQLAARLSVTRVPRERHQVLWYRAAANITNLWKRSSSLTTASRS